MECRTLDLTLVSVNGLEIMKKESVYAVASISSTSGTVQKFKTPVVKTGMWNFPIKFTVSELDGETQNLVVKINAVGMLGDKYLGKVCVPIKELLEGVTAQGKPMQCVSYQVSGKCQGLDLTFTYEFGESSVVERVVHSTRPGLKVHDVLEVVEIVLRVFQLFLCLLD